MVFQLTLHLSVLPVSEMTIPWSQRDHVRRAHFQVIACVGSDTHVPGANPSGTSVTKSIPLPRLVPVLLPLLTGGVFWTRRSEWLAEHARQVIPWSTASTAAGCSQTLTMTCETPHDSAPVLSVISPSPAHPSLPARPPVCPATHRVLASPVRVLRPKGPPGQVCEARRRLASSGRVLRYHLLREAPLTHQWKCSAYPYLRACIEF